MATEPRTPKDFDDSYTTFHFAVEIDGVTKGIFDEVTGLDVKQEVFEIKEGGMNGFVHKFPGRVSHSNVTLKFGSMPSKDLWTWYKDFVTKANKEGELKDLSILQLDQKHVEVRRWNLYKAFPVKWVGPSFKAGDSQMAVETLELAFNDMSMQP